MRRTVRMNTIGLVLAGIGTTITGSARAQQESLEVRIDRVFAEYDNIRSPGCAVGVIKNGRLMFERGYGIANLELGAPLSATSVFRIGSTSKQFTAAAVVLLAQEGRITLDDEVRWHIPELPDYGSPVTVSHAERLR